MVLDGHGGKAVVDMVKEQFPSVLVEAYLSKGVSPSNEDETMECMLLHAFRKMEEDLFTTLHLEWKEDLAQNQHSLFPPTLDGSGCTCVLCIVTPTMFWVATIGDSELMLFEAETQELMFHSIPHDLNDYSTREEHLAVVKIEKERILRDHKFFDYQRVGGTGLNVTRAFGDFHPMYKFPFAIDGAGEDGGGGDGVNPFDRWDQWAVTAKPDITRLPRDPTRSYSIVLATDGVWHNSMINETFIRHILFPTPMDEETKRKDPKFQGKWAKLQNYSNVQGKNEMERLLIEKAFNLADCSIASRDNIGVLIAFVK
jgi:serine/threonine protein phosphatase PrpC